MSNILDLKLYLMCGLAFAGKSTLAAAVAERAGAVIVSLDEINLRRGLLGGMGVPEAEWARTHRIALEEAGQALAAGRPVVIDDTNCFRFLRDDHRAVADRYGAATVVIYLDVPVDLVLRRMRENTARPTREVITEAVMADLMGKLEPPAPDEPALVYSADVEPRAWAARNILSI